MNRLHIRTEESGIFRLAINDPENSNSLDKELFFELLEALDGLTTEKDLRVLIISGLRQIFCAGGSLRFLKKLAEGRIDEKNVYALPFRLLNFPLPILAEMQGDAVSGGLILALYCDITVAAKESRYGVNFTDLGFTPGMGTTTLLPDLVGHSFANEMMFTAKLYKGRELEGTGLCNYIKPSAEVPSVVIDLARRISRKPKHVLVMLKRHLSAPRKRILQAAIDQEMAMHELCFGHSDTARNIDSKYYCQAARKTEDSHGS